WYPWLTTLPSSPTASAVTPVVPGSIASTFIPGSPGSCEAKRSNFVGWRSWVGHPSGVTRRTRYFVDTEFLENGTTIELVSIGVVCEDGREYYAVSADFDPGDAIPWVREHVLSQLPPP